jgi:hypothetical protein
MENQQEKYINKKCNAILSELTLEVSGLENGEDSQDRSSLSKESSS